MRHSGKVRHPERNEGSAATNVMGGIREFFSRRGRIRLTGAVIFLWFVASGHARDWYALSPEEFAAQPAVQARIDPEKFDGTLLAAAIFQETNRVRRQLGLVRFTHVAKLDVAAERKASLGVFETELKHTSDFPFAATPADRVKAAGLDYARVAENLARISSYDLPAGMSQLGVRKRNGSDEFYRTDTGRPPELQTYVGFATQVVASWMKSPGHHDNIVDPRFLSLGCAARPCRSFISRHEQIYAMQVFFTPHVVKKK